MLEHNPWALKTTALLLKDQFTLPILQAILAKEKDVVKATVKL
jgi:hypothetical protein